MAANFFSSAMISCKIKKIEWSIAQGKGASHRESQKKQLKKPHVLSGQYVLRRIKRPYLVGGEG